MSSTEQAHVSGIVFGGTHGWPFGAGIMDLSHHGYREDEFFLEGIATRYRPAPGAHFGRDGQWQAEPAGTAPFKTRFIVYRPTDPAKFNGTVIVSWNNVTAGYDLFNTDSLEMIEGGFAFVAVTTQRVGIEGLRPRPMGLRSWDPDRYESLHHPGDDYSYDIFTQAARAVGPARPTGPVDPLGGLEVKRVIGQGASQSAARLATYVNAIHPLSRAFDAYLLTIYFANGSPLEVGEAVVNISAPGSVQTRTLLWGKHIIREDLDVPVMVVNSELEAIACYPVRQPDTDRFRYWESAGTCHVSLQGQNARNLKYRRDFGTDMPINPAINHIPMVPLYEAAYRHMHSWLTTGTPPPIQPRLEFAGDPPEIVRDEHGLAKGGIRLPQVEAPLATNSAIPLVPDDIYALLGGSSYPFPPEKIRTLYGSRETFLQRFEAAARKAQDAGVLLPRDAAALIAEAGEQYPV
jgi:hypothetical protein